MTRAKTQRPRERAKTGAPRVRRTGASPVVPRKAPPPPPGSPARAAIPARPDSVIDDQLVEVTDLPEVPTLQLAVFEAAGQLAAAAMAIAGAGHVMAVSGSGPEGLAKIRRVVSDGRVDAVIACVPGGEAIIDAALALSPRRPVVIAAASVGSPRAAVVRAAQAGADLVVVPPYEPERLAPLLLAAARLVELRREISNARGSEAVLRSRLEDLTDPDAGGLMPFELFQRTLEMELRRARRYQYSLSVAMFAVEIPPPPPPPGVRGILRARAGNTLISTIRDIDIATEIDQERLLVLLPYTDLTGAAGLARRVIAAVQGGEPVVAAGRAFAPRLVGAVAGAKPGQQLSFGKLIKDVNRALAQARKDGAELAVAT